MRFPPEFLTELKYRNDIESVIGGFVELRRRGRTLQGLCPFHSEKTPSFVVYSETQSYYCFGCNAGGDVITFIQGIENLGYVEAVKVLADRAGLRLPEEPDDAAAKLRLRAQEACREAARYFYGELYAPGGRAALDYLLKRGLTDKTIKKFGLGFAPDSWDHCVLHLRDKGFRESELQAAGLATRGRNGGLYSYFRGRVMFPIIDRRGAVIGFGGRVIGEGGPKYLNSPDTPLFKKTQNLYGLNFSKNTRESYFILTEGYMDAIAVMKAGYDNVVATLGTALTAEQARLLSRYTKEVVIAYDGDAAGQKATERAIGVLKQVGLGVKVLSLGGSGAKDPDEFLIKYGRDRFSILVEHAGDSTAHQLALCKIGLSLDEERGRLQYLQRAVPIVGELQSPLERDIYIGKLAEEAKVGKSAIEAAVTNYIKSEKGKARQKERRATPAGGDSRAAKLNPARGRNLKAVAAEERLLMGLILHPDRLAAADAVLGGEMFSELNGKIYREIARQLSADSRIALSGTELSSEEVGYLSGLIAKSAELPVDADELLACAREIARQKQKPTAADVAASSDEELEGIIEHIRQSKKK